MDDTTGDFPPLHDDVRTNFIRHGFHMNVPTAATAGLSEFWRILCSLDLHAPRQCTAATAPLVQKCLVDGCSAVFSVSRGQDTLHFPACYIVDAVATALAPGHHVWLPFHDACASADDVPPFLLDVVLMHPLALICNVFPRLRTNVWRDIINDPLASSTIDIPSGIAGIVNVMARAFPCYSVRHEARTAPDDIFEKTAKRMRLDLTADEPDDGAAAALVHIVGPMLIRSSIAAALSAAAPPIVQSTHTAVYAAIAQACAVADAAGSTCDHVLSEKCQDLFYALHDAFGAFGAVVRRQMAAAAAPAAPKVHRCRVNDSTAAALPLAKKIADACSRRAAAALLEGLGRTAADMAAEFARSRRLLFIEDAAYGDARMLCQEAWGGHRVPETQCIATDGCVVCILPAVTVLGFANGHSLHELVIAADHENFQGMRLPIYGPMARIYFSPTPGYAVALLGALGDLPGPAMKVVAPLEVLHVLLPDFVDALLSGVPLFLLIASETYSDLRRVLPLFVQAVAFQKPIPTAAISAPIMRLLRHISPADATDAFLTGPQALARLASLLVRALAAGAITHDTVVRLLCILFPNASPPPRGPPRRWTGALEVQCGPLEPSAIPGEVLDADGRRRAAAMLTLFAMYDTTDAGLDAAEADAHLQRTIEALNLEGREARPATLGWDYPVYCGPDGGALLFDNEFVVLQHAPPSPLAVFGTAAANAVAATPIRDCAALISERVSGKAAHRLAIGRQLDELYVQPVQPAAPAGHRK